MQIVNMYKNSYHQRWSITTNSITFHAMDVPLFSFSCYFVAVWLSIEAEKINTNPNHFYLITIRLKCLTCPFHSILWEKLYHIEFDAHCANFNCNRNGVLFVVLHAFFFYLSIVSTNGVYVVVGSLSKKKWWKNPHTLYLHIDNMFSPYLSICKMDKFRRNLMKREKVSLHLRM